MEHAHVAVDPVNHGRRAIAVTAVVVASGISIGWLQPTIAEFEVVFSLFVAYVVAFLP